ncbi:4335_t:CDS:1, partial [Cetraspora pellucida]
MNTSNEHSEMEITDNNPNKSKRRNSYRMDESNRTILYPNAIKRGYPKGRKQTWHEVHPQTKDLSRINRNHGQSGLPKKVYQSSRKNERGFRKTSNEPRPKERFSGSISEAINITKTKRPYQSDIELPGWDSESLSERTSNSSERTVDIGTTRLSKNSSTNNSPTRQLQTPNRIPEEPRTTIQGNPGNIQCKICFGKYGQHEYRYCPDAICNKCRRKGHTHKDCL